MLAGRTVERVPFWRDTRTVIIDRAVGHPENAFAQYRLADALLKSGDSSRALAQDLTAYELYRGYPLIPRAASELALGLGHWRLALDLGHRAFALAPGDPNVPGSLVHVLFRLHRPDSALAVARAALSVNPRSPQMLAMYQGILERVGGPVRAVQLARARRDGLEGRYVAATATIDSVGLDRMDSVPLGICFDLRQSLPMLRLLAPADTVAARRLVADCANAVSMLPR